MFKDLVENALEAVQSTIGGEISRIIYSGGETVEAESLDFQLDHFELDQNNIAISTGKPLLDLRESDFQTLPATSDKVLFRGVTYEIDDVRSDGLGKITLILTIDDA